MADIFLSNVHYSIPVENNFRHRLQFGNYNTRWGMVIAIIAIGIKSTKTWYLQQQENLEIVKKKNRTAMQIQKARLHPEFLLRSLDTIHTHIHSGSGLAPAIILKLSDLLSYSLYENGKELVPLKSEIEHLNNFMSLEQQGSTGTLNMQIQTDNNSNSKYIVPLVIIKLLEETTAMLHNEEHAACFKTLLVTAVNNQVSLTILFHPLQPAVTPQWWHVVENTQKRLLEYYSENDFHINLSGNESEVAIKLRLTLADAPQTVPMGTNINTKTVAYDRV